MTRGDVLAIGLAAMLVGVSYARHWKPPVTATRFEVRVAGQVVGRYPLAIDRELMIDGALGLSKLKVENGRVRFAASPCRNKVCVHSGWLSHGGEAAACLPNRVSITLAGDAGSGVDAVSF
ncbi:NusG domain II-containing protein [Fontimonas sp. SYSU GA230001]|uniref:NusG domain II-containing protein n=1 Tax=Fontimonas sp. SYSU GA230001 TaxID=3142450 RepID=UPI0032B4C691